MSADYIKRMKNYPASKELTHKTPPIICNRRHFQILSLFINNNEGLFHENPLPVDNSHEISFLVCVFSKIKKGVTYFVVCYSHDWRFKD